MLTMRVINAVATLLNIHANLTLTNTNINGTKQALTVADTPMTSPPPTMPFALQGAYLEVMSIVVVAAIVIKLVLARMRIIHVGASRWGISARPPTWSHGEMA